MNDLLTTQQWYERGLDAADLRQRVTEQAVSRVRRGSYALPGGDDSAEGRHRLLVRATMPQLDERSVASHISAAVLHGLPVRRAAIGKVEVTRPDRRTGKTSGLTRRAAGKLTEADTTMVDGMRVTTIARTLVDLGRSEPLGWAVASLDHALHEKLVTLTEVEQALERLGSVRGVRQAHRMVRLANARSESVGESLSRVVMVEAGLPLPALQTRFADERGIIGRVDFYWKDLWVIGEFDGMAKYDELGRPGETARDVLRREKRREDRLRALGHIVVRWTWDEVFHTPEVVVQRIRTALEAARKAHGLAA